jgi:type III secretion protein R
MAYKYKFAFFFVLLFVFLGLSSDALFAQETQEAATEMVTPPIIPTGSVTPSVIQELAAITAMALLPFAIMLLTSYIKIVVVLSLLRNALGVQQSPPNPVLTGIALLMTIYVMFPTALSMYKKGEDYINKQPPTQLFSAESAQYLVNVIDISKEPMREFLQRNSLGKHITSFYQLAYRSFPDEFRASLKPTDFIILVPSFITSQLKAAFEIGVLIYLPFFVIDLVTSNILLAMGMMMLSPLTIALPLKLLLIVMVDGWTLIIQGLVLSFR